MLKVTLTCDIRGPKCRNPEYEMEGNNPQISYEVSRAAEKDGFRSWRPGAQPHWACRDCSPLIPEPFKSAMSPVPGSSEDIWPRPRYTYDPKQASHKTRVLTETYKRRR